MQRIVSRPFLRKETRTFAPHRTALILCAAAAVGCNPDSGSKVLAPADVLAPARLQAAPADMVPVYNFSVRFRDTVNAVNTTALEHEASFTQDGHTMYFKIAPAAAPRRVRAAGEVLSSMPPGEGIASRAEGVSARAPFLLPTMISPWYFRLFGDNRTQQGPCPRCREGEGPTRG
jgi:hypothetical protein